MIFNDPVLGNIELPPLCIKIIDTLQFQRLRDIKQLSLCCYVYPGGIHSRFEHSLGTCFLAGKLVKHLKKQDPLLGITGKDVVCVEIAALCHDLGHGPFSHLWEEFMTRVKPDVQWKHEDASVNMMNYLIEENNLEGSFRAFFGDQYEKYLTFIKLQISGTAEDRINYPWKLSEEEDKSFLYEVVSNKETGLDVDKWDYISRDCHYLGFKHNFYYDRIITFSRVIDVDGKKRLCLPKKELLNLHSMYYSRFHLHSRAYHHPAVKVIDCMVLDALVLANDKIVYRNGHKSVNMCDATFDLKCFSTMTDSIFQKILYSNKRELEPAKKILERIHTRDLYKYLGEVRLSPSKSAEHIEEIIFRNMQESVITAERNIAYMHKSVGFGMKGKNPLLDTYFYTKSTPNSAKRVKKHEISCMIPKFEDCEEEFVLFFCRSSNENVFQDVKEGFETARSAF